MLLYLGALEGGRINELGRDGLFGRGLDIGSLDLRYGVQEVLLGRMGKAGLFRSLVHNDHVAVRHIGSGKLINHILGHHRKDLLDEVVLLLGVHVGVLVEEVVQERRYEVGVGP